MQDKYTYLRKINFDILWMNRGKIIQVYPEVTKLFTKMNGRGCKNCRKKRIVRGILTKIIELPSEGRNLNVLQGVLPTGLIKLL